MTTIRVKATGMDQFRKALRGLDDKELLKLLRLSYKEASTLVASRAGAAAGRRAKSIRPRATQRSASVAVTASRGDELGVFFGAKGRFGWFSNPRYRRSSARQFRPWVGNQWDPGEQGGKPYFIGDAINASVDDVIEVFADAIDRLAAKAFPD